MNAKETLQKIAEALNIVSSEKETEQVEQPVAEQPAEEVAQEEQAESTQEEQPVAEVTEEPAEEVAEEPAAEEQKEEPKSDPRVEELERQLADLKEILKNATAQPVEEEKVVPEPPKPAEPKGLTHSPEKQVKTKAKGVGNKGGDIMSRVFKYMNNN